MRKGVVVSAIIAAAACLFAWTWARVKPAHQLTLYSYYRHAENVKKGVPVCVDGVQLGWVTKVRVRPELGERPVELALSLNPPYELKIPGGSQAQISEIGIFGPTVVDIDTRDGHGPALASGSTIEGRESTSEQAAHALGTAVSALLDQAKESQHQSVADDKAHSK